MTAEHPEDLIGAFLDNELDDVRRKSIAAHLAICPACAALAEEIGRTSRRVAGAGRLAMPADLPSRVRAALAVGAAAPPNEEPKARPAWRFLPGRMSRTVQNLAPLAAAVVAAAILSSAATMWLATGGKPNPVVAHDLLTAHLRSLAQDGAIQVASSDAHTVKPWFAGKVEFSPDARDLAAEGFQLVGGRLDIVDGRRVGAVVYRRRMHLIDVFAWPATSGVDTPPAARTERGYSLLTWTKSGVIYWAISDLDIEELKRLAGLL